MVSILKIVVMFTSAGVILVAREVFRHFAIQHRYRNGVRRAKADEGPLGLGGPLVALGGPKGGAGAISEPCGSHFGVILEPF